MSDQPRTLGEAVKQNWVCVLFERTMRLAEAVGRIPVGFWIYELQPEWTLTVNGTKEACDDVQPYRARIVGELRGWPVVVMFDPAGGVVAGGTEDDVIAVLDHAIERARAVQS